MAIPWKLVAALALILPMGAYIAGTVVGPPRQDSGPLGQATAAAGRTPAPRPMSDSRPTRPSAEPVKVAASSAGTRGGRRPAGHGRPARGHAYGLQDRRPGGPGKADGRPGPPAWAGGRGRGGGEGFQGQGGGPGHGGQG